MVISQYIESNMNRRAAALHRRTRRDPKLKGMILALGLLGAVCACVVAPSSSWARGLYGEYFNGLNFEDELPIARVDPQVSFNWRSGAPMEGIGENQFSVRWRGWITPSFSERYQIITRSDDGVRVWIDEELIIDSWRNQGPTRIAVNVDFIAGRPHYVQVEYFENGGGALMELGWESASQPFEQIPAEALSPLQEPPPQAQLPSAVAGISFDRSLINEGGEAKLNVYRLGDLSHPVTLSIEWSGDALERLSSLPEQITIPARRSVESVVVRTVNDDSYQGTRRLIAQLAVSGSGDETGGQVELLDQRAELVIVDDEYEPGADLYTVTGALFGEDVDRFEVSAVPISSDQDNADPVRYSEVSLGEIYSLALPAGRYLVSARALRDSAWEPMQSAELLEVEIEVPPHQLELDWSAMSLNTEDHNADDEPDDVDETRDDEDADLDDRESEDHADDHADDADDSPDEISNEDADDSADNSADNSADDADDDAGDDSDDDSDDRADEDADDDADAEEANDQASLEVNDPASCDQSSSKSSAPLLFLCMTVMIMRRRLSLR